MPIVVVSDVHSNIHALDAVFRDAEEHSAVDGVWCLGDIVGYNAHPGEVIASLRERNVLAVAGNHDLASCGLMSVEEFNPVATHAVEWTAEYLTADEKQWLSSLDVVETTGDWTLVHGSLRAPEWEYLLDAEQADAQFGLQTTAFSLVGHSHLTFHVRESERSAPESFVAHYDGDVVGLDGTRLIVNPGSVGQPRDGDPRASYLLYDESTATITWRRVEYDVAAAQRDIIDAGLPPSLARRLAIGR